MASSSKKTTLEVAVETEQQNIDALDKKLDDTKQKVDSLKQQKVQLQVNADIQKLSEVKSKITELENKRTELKVGVDDVEIRSTEQEIARLKQEQVRLEVNLEDHKLRELQSKMDAIEADEINVQLNNQSAMEGLNQIADGFSRIKSAASEVGQQFGDLLSSAGKQETNFAFLKNAVGDAELARQKMSEINDIVAQLPGDDTALQGLLSSAAAKDSSLTAENLRDMANSATDYFSAMSFYGKSATEAQQDMTNYILAGNTAELERSPILQGHIDKLKEATTVQERSKALAEALNAEHWGGMGAMDTYNNKLETFNGMIERGRYTLGGMFQEGAKGAMDFLLKLDESTNGLVGMTIAAGGFLSPVTDAVMGLGQMATGLKSLKDLGAIKWLKELELGQKASAAAQWLLNAAMNANPIILIVLAIIALIGILWYLYNTNEDVRNAIDAFGQALWGIGEAIYGTIMGALQWLNDQIQWLGDSFQSASDTIMTYAPLIAQVLFVMATGGVGAIVLLVANFMGMPNQVGGALQSVITRVAGFVGNIVGRLANGARQAVSNFVSGIASLPGQVYNELQRTLDRVMDWGSQIVGRLGEIAQRAWQAFVSGLGIGSPGYIQILTLKELDDTGKRVPQVASRIVGNLNKAAGEAVDAWGNPTFEYGFANDDIVKSSKSATNSGKGQVSYTFNLYGDIDNEERMQRFVDEVRRQIDWENTKCGRNMDVI